MWWRHERVHRKILENFEAYLSAYQKDRNKSEAELIHKSLSAIGKPGPVRQSIEDEGFSTSYLLDNAFLEHTRINPEPIKQGWLHRIEWRGHNQKAGFK
jgi:hypothetical protein